MNEKGEILIDNFEEYFELGLNAFNKNKHNTATTLFFKAIVSLCDLYIFLLSR